MKPLIIYHANCADGFGAAFAAWMKLGDDAEYLPVQYGEKVPLDPSRVQYEDREVYVLDFSFSREAMERLFANAKRVVWLDHHKTAFEIWCGAGSVSSYTCHDRPERHITLDNSKSGAYLAWEYFHPGTEVPMLIRHIDDYDRWQFKLERTKEFNKALWSYTPWSFKQWECLCDLERGVTEGFAYISALNFEAIKFTDIYTQGAAILRAHEQNVQSVVKGAARACNIPWFTLTLVSTGLAANCPPHLTSDVGHALATQCGTYGLLWSINKDGKCICSLRSNGNYDVSAIAKVFGGGGHKAASGFTIDVTTLLEWIN